ncbi:MAG: hypothetical protein ACR2RB_01270 [Gammaproteobacteria bacterium]
MFGGPANAAGWVFQPTVALGASYSDNYTLSPNLERSVLRSGVSGELGLSRLTDSTTLTGLFRADFAVLSGDDEGLDDNQNQLLTLNYVNKRERHEFGVDSFIKHDSLIRSVDIVVDPDDVTIEPDADVDDGLEREVNVERFRFFVNPKWTHRFTELTNVGAEYRLSNTQYDDAGTTDLFEFSNHFFSTGFSRRVTERDRITGAADATLFRASDVDREYDSFALAGGLEHNFTETLQGRVNVGVRTTSFDVEGDSGDDTGVTFRVDGTKRTGLTIFSGRIQRSLRPSGSGDVVESDELVLNVSRRLTELISFSLRTRLFENESLQSVASDANRRFFSFSPRLRWNISRWWSVDTNYRYRRSKRFNEPESSEDNTAFVSLNYSKPTQIAQ